MTFLSIGVGLLLLLLLVAVWRVNTFIAFLLVCLLVGLLEGLSVGETFAAIQTGIGDTMGSLAIILGLGAMLGKLVAESGAANAITNGMVARFGLRRIQWALMVTGFIVGIPMFYLVGFVILVPLAIAIAHQTELPLLYIGLPMLAALSVTHGFLPPHPAPTAIAELYGADLGRTLLYGLIVGIPAILSAKFLLARTMRRIRPPLLPELTVTVDERYRIPKLGTAIAVALLPVLLIGGSALLEILLGPHPLLTTLGNPALAMLLSVLLAGYFIGTRTGRKLRAVMEIFTGAISDIAVVLFVIAGAGAFKEVMVQTQISDEIGAAMAGLGLSPLLLAWLIAAVIRICVGSATVAALTAAGIMLPLAQGAGVPAELLVLATGAGSLVLSHVNDGGFWLFKEYFNVSIKETLLSWTLMETTVSVVGLIGVLLLNSVL